MNESVEAPEIAELKNSPAVNFLHAVDSIVGPVESVEKLTELDAELRQLLAEYRIEQLVNELQGLANLKESISAIRSAWLSDKLEVDPEANKQLEVEQRGYEEALADYQRAVDQRLGAIMQTLGEEHHED